jgi:ABC-type dipeptide/oligopeptide/nickel transport system permease component
MIRFALHRLVSSIPVLIGIVTAVFILARVIPSDPCRATLGERATAEVCDAFNERVGLNEPIYVQFFRYLGDLLHGDLGESFSQGRSVAEILVERLPTTIELSVLALTFAMIVGIPLGVIAAYKRNSAADVGTMVVANAGVSMPIFVLGLVLQYVFAVLLQDTFLALPPSGRLSPGLVATPFYEAWGLGENGVLTFISNFEILNGVLQWNWELVVDAAQHLILPAIAVGTIPLAIIARMTRSSLLDVLGQDYVRTARAKGFGELSVVRRHALRSALLPVVTVVGLSLGALFGGAILTETIFGLTGVGKTLYDSITSRDYAVVQGFALVVGVSFVLVNLFTDLLYTVFDPRVRVS